MNSPKEFPTSLQSPSTETGIAELQAQEPQPATQTKNQEPVLGEKLASIRTVLREEFNGENPDALFVFSGGIRQVPGTDRYRTFGYSALSEHGIATGSRTRVIAAAKIAEAMPELLLVTNSFNRFDPHEPTMARVIRDELVRRDVNPGRIELEESSFSTITQLMEMIKMATANSWGKVSILINEYHLPRTREMYERLDSIVDDDEFQADFQEFRSRGGQVVFVSAETIMRLASKHYKKYLEAVEKTPAFAATLASEQQGLKDLRAGRYRVLLKPEQPRP